MGKKNESIFLKIRTRQGCLLSPILFNVPVLEVLATAIRKEEEIRGMQITKEEEKLSLFADVKIIYRENTKTPLKNLVELINDFSEVAE